MKIVKELGNGVSMSVLEEVYKRGNKLAISFKEDTMIGFRDEGSDGKDILKKGYMLNKEELLIKKNELVVIDLVKSDKCGDLAFVHSYSDDREVAFLLYGGDVIADKVFEVTV